MDKEEMAKLPELKMPDDKKLYEVLMNPQLDAELAGKGNATHMSKKVEKYAKIKAWLETPPSQRMSIVLFRRTNKITRPMFEELKRNYLSNLDDLRRQRARDASRYIEDAMESVEKPAGSIMDLEEDPMTWWKARQLELNMAILASAVTGNAQSQKLAKQLAGELVEKQEIKIGLSAEDRARRMFQAQEELKKEGYIDISVKG